MAGKLSKWDLNWHFYGMLALQPVGHNADPEKHLLSHSLPGADICMHLSLILLFYLGPLKISQGVDWHCSHLKAQLRIHWLPGLLK